MWNSLFGTSDFMRSLDLAVGFDELIKTQRVVSGMIPGHITEPPTNKQVMLACFALQGEVFELAQELGWKDWKENPEMTDEQRKIIAEEFADILAFLGYLMNLIKLRTDLKTEDLADAYFAKAKKNMARFLGESGEEGYTGVVVDGEPMVMEDWWNEVPGTAVDDVE